MAKVSRHHWPEDKRERIAVICANLTVWVPYPRGYSARGKLDKETLEELEDDGNDD